MTEHVHEYCMDHFVTGGKCCPDGLHRTDCKLLPAIEGHNKERNSHAPLPMTTREKVGFLVAIIATLVGIGMVLA